MEPFACAGFERANQSSAGVDVNLSRFDGVKDDSRDRMSRSVDLSLGV